MEIQICVDVCVRIKCMFFGMSSSAWVFVCVCVYVCVCMWDFVSIWGRGIQANTLYGCKSVCVNMSVCVCLCMC